MAEVIRPTRLMAAPEPAKVEPVEVPGINALLTLAVAVVVVAGLYFGRTMLVPITLAVLLSFLLAPLASALRRLRLGRTISVLLAVLLALTVLLGVTGTIGVQIADLTTDLPRYQAVLQTKVTTIRTATVERLAALENHLGSDHGAARPATARPLTHVPQGTASNPMTVEVQTPPPSPLDMVRRIAGPVLEPLGTIALVLLISIFIMLQKEDLRDRLIRLFGSSDLHRTTQAMNDAARRLSKYFLTQLAINTGYGCFVTIGLTLIGLPSPMLWGLIALLLRFVPYVGVYISASLPVLLAASVVPGWDLAFWTLGLFLVGELIVGQMIEPFAYGHSTGLSPVSVVVAALFWTWIWGPVGLLLATPLTLCLVVLGRHVKRLEFLDVLLGDRPALTPVESLYQRMLANDPDEAAHQAEQLLRERPLSVYYDEVVLRAMVMAANDVRRGVLSRERQLVMRDTICSLVEDLDEHEDVTPAPGKADDGPVAPSEAERAVPVVAALDRRAPPLESLPPAWRGDGAVLCIGGRGPIDDAGATMLAQLVRKHGLGARVALHEAVSRAAIGALDVGPVGAICISYAEATGSPAHLRFLVRRLRQKAPGAVVLLALWRGEAATQDWDDDLLKMTDAAAGSLREMLTRVLDAAAAAEARLAVSA
jgi:predicted PurR-regulated permease PerM